MKNIFGKKIVAMALIGVAFTAFAAGCSHGSDSSAETTQTTSSGPAVVVEPTTTTQPTTTTEPGIVTPDAPSEPQVSLTTRYVLTAMPRQPDDQGRVRERVVPIYHSPGGSSINKQPVLDANGEPDLDSSGNPRIRTTCLEDYPDNCNPTDPTYWNARLTFLVTQGSPGDEWAEVLLSTRPNNTRGWVSTEDFTWSAHDFHIIIDLSEKTVSVWQGSEAVIGLPDSGQKELILHTLAIIGTASTPTPVIATTYVEAKIYNVPASRAAGGFGPVYGTWILPLAAFSEVHTEFQGGSPQVAIHGTDIPQRVGERLSNGCIRIPNPVIEQIAALVPIGTPVSIIA